MPTTIYLVRHGETAGNRVRRYQTYDTPLSDAGREQAQRLAERLAAEGPFAALYASDLARTLETANAIGAKLGLVPRLERRLRELDVGDWKGTLYEEIERQFPGHRERWIAAGGVERLPGAAGESTVDVQQRVLAAFEAIARRHPGERVIAVSHGWALAVLVTALHGWDQVEAFREQRLRFDNTAVSVFEVDAAGGRRCLLMNCTRHLPSPPAPLPKVGEGSGVPGPQG